MSGAFILGPDLSLFEEEVGEWLGSSHAIAVSSGTSALWLSLKAAGVGPGDKVLTSPFTFFATVSAIMNVGAQPVFCDILPSTFNMDPNAAEAILRRDTSRKIKAIIPVHLYGQAADLESIVSLADKYHLSLIEDAAQAIGAEVKDKKAATWGHFGCLSFFPTKNLGGLGDGGLVTTQDGALAEKIRVLRVHGAKTKYYHDVIGDNCRMDTMQAAILRVFLPQLKEWIQQRQSAAKFYDRHLRDISTLIDIPSRVGYGNHTFHQYTLRVKDNLRDSLKEYLDDKGIGATVYYPVPCHLQKALAPFGFQKGDFPHAELAALEVLSLPVFPGITEEELTTVSSAINGFLALGRG